MDINEEALNAINKSIEIYFNMQKDKLPFDKTLQARIVSKDADNKYTVAITGSEYPSVPSCTDIIFTANDSVWVTLPQGKMNAMFILGRRRD